MVAHHFRNVFFSPRGLGCRLFRRELALKNVAQLLHVLLIMLYTETLVMCTQCPTGESLARSEAGGGGGGKGDMEGEEN